MTTVVIQVGSRVDYDALASHHYRAGSPATFARILAARDEGARLVGVLVVSNPVLAAAWRDQAWPGRFTSGPLRDRAGRINAELRTISRVIVAPPWRGQGVARRLVRAYLADPITTATEAVASMGVCCPFFRAAGMTEFEVPMRACDARFLRALESAGVSPLDLARGAWVRSASRGMVERALRAWANRSRTTRALASLPARDLAWHAASALVARPRAYAHDHQAGPTAANG